MIFINNLFNENTTGRIPKLVGSVRQTFKHLRTTNVPMFGKC